MVDDTPEHIQVDECEDVQRFHFRKRASQFDFENYKESAVEHKFTEKEMNALKGQLKVITVKEYYVENNIEIALIAIKMAIFVICMLALGGYYKRTHEKNIKSHLILHSLIYSLCVIVLIFLHCGLRQKINRLLNEKFHKVQEVLKSFNEKFCKKGIRFKIEEMVIDDQYEACGPPRLNFSYIELWKEFFTLDDLPGIGSYERDKYITFLYNPTFKRFCYRFYSPLMTNHRLSFKETETFLKGINKYMAKQPNFSPEQKVLFLFYKPIFICLILVLLIQFCLYQSILQGIIIIAIIGTLIKFFSVVQAIFEKDKLAIRQLQKSLIVYLNAQNKEFEKKGLKWELGDLQDDGSGNCGGIYLNFSYLKLIKEYNFDEDKRYSKYLDFELDIETRIEKVIEAENLNGGHEESDKKLLECHDDLENGILHGGSSGNSSKESVNEGDWKKESNQDERPLSSIKKTKIVHSFQDVDHSAINLLSRKD